MCSSDLLNYRIADHHVDASHRVRLRQFELGERVEGQPGFGVPLGLLVALLKDRDGNIDLDVPLTGSLKDPNFHLGQMAWKVVGNLFRKVAASPFALLGSLFGSGEEISWVEFAAGSTDLDGVAREHLATLAKAMTARPGSSGVDRTFVVRTSPVSSCQRMPSVKVPPVSIPMRQGRCIAPIP